MKLFYRSVFYKRKEFEYTRVPDNWFYRYTLHKGSIAKVALKDNKVVGSLGVINRVCKLDGEKVRVGCFVDNCVLPTHTESYEEILGALLQEIESDLKKCKVAALYGWDYLKHLNEHRKFFEEIGFEWVEGVNWYPGGSTPSGEHPYKWEIKLSPYWRIGFGLLGYMHRIREFTVGGLPPGIMIKHFNVNDVGEVKKVIKVIESCYATTEFAPCYNYSEFRHTIRSNGIQGFIAERGSEVIGVLTYIAVPWSGWMLGKPSYDSTWQIAFTFTPDEFAVIPEYQKSGVPENMILKMMKLRDPHKETYGSEFRFIVDIFDRRIGWRRDSLLRVGCDEPTYDHGVILAKSLRKDIILDCSKPWYLPARFIVAPGALRLESN